MALYQAPYAAMQLVGAWLVWRARDRRPLEMLLLAVLALTTLHYLSKPFVAMASGGTGAGPESYLQTSYALFSQASGTVLAFAVALLLLVILVRNVLSDITTRSETDALSGLLNRRGFEDRRDDAMRQKTLNGLPVSLVVADLDRFKLVNDTLGHAAGDRVIAAFGQLIRQNIHAYQAAGRVGGEEFAILLPGSNLAAARLFAENLRTSFGLMEIEGVGGRRFTASFGVAELRNGERSADFEARADSALYAAKKGGRDRVEVAMNGLPAFALRRASDRRASAVSVREPPAT
jgi:diguanylate cyclase (GGDEF)-like protein